MASNTSEYILQKTDAPHSGGCNDPNCTDACEKVSKLALVALKLNGHEASLFKSHISFKEGSKFMEIPCITSSFQFLTITSLFINKKLEACLKWEGDADEKKTPCV